MTCQEFRDHLERNSLAPDFPIEIDEIAGHTASCSHCNHFMEERIVLARHLFNLRGSVPELPTALDRAVLADYRRQMSERTARRFSLTLRGALSWAAAVSFAFVVAYAIATLVMPHEEVWQNRQAATPHRTVAAIPTTSQTASRPQKAARIASKSVSSAPRRKSDPVVTRADSAPIERFQSLMYCDPLSCPGAMDVIQVQLATPSSMRPGGVVSAEVLVGPDGVARGIRVVQ